MVIRGRGIWLWIWLGWLPGAGLAASLSLSLDSPRVARGAAVIAEVQARGLPSSLERLDLAPLEEDFAVDRLSLDDIPGGQRLRLRLHPRRTGPLAIPALSLDGVRSPSRRLQVVVDRKRGLPIPVDLQSSATTVWQRQMLRVTFSVTTPDEFAVLRTDPARLPTMAVHRLPLRQDTVMRNGHRRQRLRIGWAIHPLAPGTFRIELPPVAYRLGGGTERRWFLPRLALSVKPLPDYLPPTLPVGSLQVTSRLEPEGTLLTRDRLASWIIRLRSPDIPPAWFPAVLRGVRSDAAIRFFPASPARRMAADGQGLGSEVEYRVTFKPLADGRLPLPELRIACFDPQTGRLRIRHHTPPRPWVLSGGWQALLELAGLAISGFLLHVTLRRLRQHQRRRRRVRAALVRIANAPTPQDLREALRLHARAMGWPENLTLTGWLRHWQARFRCEPALISGIQRLMQACYGQASVDMQALRQELYTALRAARRQRGRARRDSPACGNGGRREESEG